LDDQRTWKALNEISSWEVNTEPTATSRRLSDVERQEIRTAFATEKYTLNDLAIAYEVSIKEISNVVNKERSEQLVIPDWIRDTLEAEVLPAQTLAKKYHLTIASAHRYKAKRKRRGKRKK
jgi:hypothetical protein